MEHLWSPWRLAYITGTGQPTGCVFCSALDSPDAAPLILHRGPTCFVILNLFPYNNGHLMVVPHRHLATLDAMSETAPNGYAESVRRYYEGLLR